MKVVQEVHGYKIAEDDAYTSGFKLISPSGEVLLRHATWRSCTRAISEARAEER